MKHLILILFLYTLSIGFADSYAQTKHNFLHYFPDSTFATEIARITNKNLNDNVTMEDFLNLLQKQFRYYQTVADFYYLTFYHSTKGG